MLFKSILFGFGLLTVVSLAQAKNDVLFLNTIPEFHQVNENIYRGGRPYKSGLQTIAQLKVKTILNLENDDEAVSDEIIDAATLGIRVIHQPMSGFWYPDSEQVSQTLRILANKNNYPIFVHCEHGQDRTGLIVGLYRVIYEKWSPAKAYNEMLTNGFHPILVFLNHFFEEETGFEDMLAGAA
jgi:tyrosine-protein phosphatase SIW14